MNAIKNFDVRHPSTQQGTTQKRAPMNKIVRFYYNARYSKQQAFEYPKGQASTAIEPQIFSSEERTGSSSIRDISIDESFDETETIFCSTRALIITFIIIVLIIIVVAITIGVIIGTVNSRENSSSSENSNTSSLSTVASSYMGSTVSIGSQTGLPCSSYTTINDPTRSVTQTTVYGVCDQSEIFNATTHGSWIRFVGAGGTTIPLLSPAPPACGAYVVGWFNGTMPTTPGTSMNATICFSVYQSVVLIERQIEVMNCNGFFIYLLPPVDLCNGRYCTT
ncbi:unnamed protein product [Adineta ricciae]|uniref:Uncharacterized protein n=1 Tax=Adineta ricciae TaxID=249248 RepID=A0A814JBV9_ADIRI|nr:unnamed protein product [Adineta ricciae]CAF1142921.1 unnamed protein product [Adineta ricciae]